MPTPSLVRIERLERFLDMSGHVHPDFESARQASIHGLLSALIADQCPRSGSDTSDAIANAIMAEFEVDPRLSILAKGAL